MSEVFSEIKKTLTMPQVARHLGYEPNRAGFIKSPFQDERTASCKLYERSFYDFSANTGGDLIRFTAAVLGLNNWQAACYLVDAFSLPYSVSGSKDNREQIKKRQQERARQQEKEQRFKDAWLQEVDKLKRWEHIFTLVIEKQVFPPMSDLWAYAVMELQKVSYRLDVLCLTGSRREQEELLKEAGWSL